MFLSQFIHIVLVFLEANYLKKKHLFLFPEEIKKKRKKTFRQWIMLVTWKGPSLSYYL